MCERLMRWPTRYAWMVSLLVVGVVLGLLAVVGLPSAGSDDRVAEARAFLVEIPDRVPLSAGQVLHLRTEVYFRYGEKAKDIAARTRIATEIHTREAWQEIGPNDTVVRSFATLTDALGATVQESVFQNGVLREVDPRTGDVLADEPPPGLENGALKITTPKGRATQYERALAEGRARVLRQAPSEVTLETRQDLPARITNRQWGTGDFQVPYSGDLMPKSMVTRVTIRADGIVSIAEVYVISASGEQVLIQSERVTVTEVLARMPDGLF